jgi:hypothetical protein
MTILVIVFIFKMLREKFEKNITQYPLNYFDIISNGLADKFEKNDSGASKKNFMLYGY